GQVKRREFLIATGAAALSASVPAGAQSMTVRQGYQTNMWGMPTYYLIRSGALERHGIKVEEFAVPSGNLTMQQMVGRQVDLGTYAGPSFIIGYDKGGLVAIAQIETVGKTAAIVARHDLGINQIAGLKGKKIANQTGSSVGNIFVDQIGPDHGLKKGEYQEVRMNVNDMVAAMAAKTVDAMVNVEPYNAMAEAEGLGNILMNFASVDPIPVFMAATPDFVQKEPQAVIAYLKAWLDVSRDFKQNPKKVADVIYSFYASKGYKMSQDTFAKALARVEVAPGFPRNLEPYLTHHAKILLGEKKIAAIPDWKKALRPDFLDKARA
ncbi:MAG TPA: ABC transporter substrate-binding protein, partial [Burkholderiales bacterium]|nr:ABC transporter substrate-binding protein [Burkholderiales bacterium]